jgi:hypothetical protein
MTKQTNLCALCTLLSVALFVLYIASIGPACWVSSRLGGENAVSAVYIPVTWTAEVSGCAWPMKAINRYSRFGMTRVWLWRFNSAAPGNAKWLRFRLASDSNPFWKPGATTEVFLEPNCL